jgi:hypothetical protein
MKLRNLQTDEMQRRMPATGHVFQQHPRAPARMNVPPLVRQESKWSRLDGEFIPQTSRQRFGGVVIFIEFSRLSSCRFRKKIIRDEVNIVPGVA